MEGNVSGYVCNHGSPNGERDTASPRLWTMLRTQASDEEADDVFSLRHLYCGTPVVTSWAVAGQQVVFLHMYLQTRVTLRAFPVATPRGRSVSFPIWGTMVTYVTWDVCHQSGSHSTTWTLAPHYSCTSLHLRLQLPSFTALTTHTLPADCTNHSLHWSHSCTPSPTLYKLWTPSHSLRSLV